MFSMFMLGNSFACGARSARLRRLVVRRKLEDAGYRRCWRHAHCRREHAPLVCKSNPNLNQWPLRALFCLKLDNSCCYARYSCGNNCNIVVKPVQEYHCFLYILLLFHGKFAANDMFLREVNSYKRALALRNSRQMLRPLLTGLIVFKAYSNFKFVTMMTNTQCWYNYNWQILYIPGKSRLGSSRDPETFTEGLFDMLDDHSVVQLTASKHMQSIFVSSPSLLQCHWTKGRGDLTESLLWNPTTYRVYYKTVTVFIYQKNLSKALAGRRRMHQTSRCNSQHWY